MMRLSAIFSHLVVAVLVLVAFYTAPVPVYQPPLPSPPPRDVRFGWVEAYQVPDVSSQYRVAWQRVRLHWAEVQPTGSDEWLLEEITEAEMAVEVAAGREMVGLLIGLPAWALDEQRLPAGLWLPEDDPNNLFAGYVRMAVGRYAGIIDRWIIWNEPDVWDETHPGHTFYGSELDFARLMQVAYRVAKETNPNAIIHLTGLSHYWDTIYGRDIYLRRLLNAIEELDPNATDSNYYFDVATLQLYFDPLANYQLLSDYIAYLRSRGLQQPIWLVETNAPPSLDPYYPVPDAMFTVSLEDQAAYMPQILALSLAAGVERVAIYTAIDPLFGSDPEPFGLVRRDGSLRPAVFTYATAARYLAGATSAQAENMGSYMVVRVQHPHHTTTLYWAFTTEPLTLTLPIAEPRVLVDAYGNAEWVYPNHQGLLTLTLPAASCNHLPCHLGGLPVYLIEFTPPSCLLPVNLRGVILC